MKFANYRSFDNYASRAKRAHIEAGGVWTQDLELEVKDASRSVNRGIGPPRQSAPLPMDKLIRVGSDTAVHCDHGPIDPVRAITIMCHFVVREIEAAFALAKHWKFDHEAKTITWHLPVSKTDPTAVGCFRSWGCICVPPKTSSLDCPWHTACEYWSQLKERFANQHGTLNDDLPLFPDQRGQVVTKAAMIDTIEILARALGEDLVNDTGGKRFGGHTPRVTGARYWASIGLEMFKIQILARWGSPVILRYVSEAPLQTITMDVQKRMSVDKVWNAISELDRNLSDMQVKAAEEVQVQSRKENPVRKKESSESGVSWVINPKSGVWHAPMLFGTQFPPGSWRTKCGWFFGNAIFEVTERKPSNNRLCDRCVPGISTYNPENLSTDSSEDD